MTTVSVRESEVLELVGAGLSNAQIGSRLFISVRTVESHVSALLRKLDLADRKELAARATGTDGDRAARLDGAPEAFTSFVGRHAELERVAAAVASARLVTLTGPGGIGKTRLAIEAGRRHDATAKWFVDLVPTRPAQVMEAIAVTLELTEQPDRPLEAVVHEALAGRPVLLVLDNCEHVLDAVAVATRRLLQRCPDAVVLATSREPLGVPGELVVPIQPLAVAGDDDSAVTLFLERAEAAGAVLSPADRPAIAAICERLDGMPLAIELAAARCATLGLDGVADALDDRLRLLSGARGAEERHRSLRAVLDWSYELLDADERRVLPRLAVFHGSFRLADAAAVTNDVVDAAGSADVVGRLAAKSLVVHTRRDGTGSTYRLLETVREYGLACLDATGDHDRARELHLEWAIALAGQLEADLVAHDAIDHATDDVLDDLRAAFHWAGDTERRESAHVLARRIAHLAYGRRFTSLAQLRFQEASEYASDDGEAARDLVDAGHTAFAMMSGDLGYACFIDAAERAERAGDSALAAYALACAVERGNRFPAEFQLPPDRAVLDAHLARAHELDPGDDAMLRTQLVISDAWLSEQIATAATEPAAQAALAAARASGDAAFESSALDALSAAAWSKGRMADSAAVAFDRIVLLARLPIHDPRAGAERLDILHMASDVPLARGDLPTALGFSLAAVDDPSSEGAMRVLHRELVVALCLTGRFDDALDEAAAMRHLWESSGRHVAGWMAPATYLAALVFALRGQRDEFETWWEISNKVCLTPENAVRAFVAVRLALHEDRLDDAFAAIAQYRVAQGTVDNPFPWSLSSLGYEGYLWSTVAEVWAARGLADAQSRIDGVRATFGDHLWAQPCLLRAEGRLHNDPDRLRRAAEGFAAIDACFEEAATLALSGGDAGARGRAALAALGCTVGPAAPAI